MNPKSLILTLGLSLAATGMAGAAEKTFQHPRQNGNRLDWCYTFQHDCGKPAANAWCQARGYEKSTGFSKAENVGTTRTVGDGSVCADSNCDSFQKITCFKADSAGKQTYFNPKFKNYRLDWCYGWAKQCGEPAAEAFCQMKGFGKAAGFKKAPGLPATRVIGTGQVCDGNCDGFSEITCE